MVESNKLKLGIFVTLSALVLGAGLFILGLGDIFEERDQFFTVFDESVQGLETGAAIKYKGVTIGKVKKISIWKERYVRVDMEAEPGSVSDDHMNPNLSKAENIAIFNTFLKNEVNKGLRCQLEIQSLATGFKFIELNHIDLKKEREIRVAIDDRSAYVPAMKSTLSGAITNFDKTLSNIAKIDYETIGLETQKALISINKILSQPKLYSAAEKSDKVLNELLITIKSANSKIDDFQIKKIQTGLLSNITNFDAVILQLNKRISTSIGEFDSAIKMVTAEIKAAKIAHTSKAARDAFNKTGKAFTAIEQDTSKTMAEARKFLLSMNSLKADVSKTLKSMEGAGKSMGGLRGDFTSTLKRFKQTLDSVQTFVDYLEKDPGSLLRGKSVRADD
ncbi:MAG: MCE family protein [Lentisphaeraceae bacterium]|nr:MCE family protein [Lentisphaeraceae bacterium]